MNIVRVSILRETKTQILGGDAPSSLCSVYVRHTKGFLKAIYRVVQKSENSAVKKMVKISVGPTFTEVVA